MSLLKSKAPPVQPQQSDFGNQQMYVWVKSLEGKVNNLLREMRVLKNDFITKQNALRQENKSLSEELMETKHENEKLRQKVDLIIKELKQSAGREEVMTLKKYVDLWNPLNFVTQKDIKREITKQLALQKSPHKLSSTKNQRTKTTHKGDTNE